MKSVYALIVIGAVVFTLLFVGTKIDLLGYEVKVVKSGSMEPAINVGGIVVVAAAQSYKVGDIITFGADTWRRIPVTHRIVEVVPTGMTTSYRTKGDANEEPDNKLVRHGDIIGKVAFDLPFVGYAINFARTPIGFILLVGIPALLIVLDESANIVWEFHKYRFRRRKTKNKASLTLPKYVAQKSVSKRMPSEHLTKKEKHFDVVSPSYSYKRKVI